jgi:hypothetical protein
MRAEVGGGVRIATPVTEATVETVESWDLEDVEDWLRSRNCPDEVVAAFRSHEVGGPNLLEMDQGALVAIAHRIPMAQKLLKVIRGLIANAEGAIAFTEPPPLPDMPREADARPQNPAVAIPNEFLCPITGEVMVDPVVATDGNTYERSAIAQWLNRGPPYRSPLTNLPMESATLTGNMAFKKLIRDFFEQHPELRQEHP